MTKAEEIKAKAAELLARAEALECPRITESGLHLGYIGPSEFELVEDTQDFLKEQKIKETEDFIKAKISFIKNYWYDYNLVGYAIDSIKEALEDMRDYISRDHSKDFETDGF